MDNLEERIGAMLALRRRLEGAGPALDSDWNEYLDDALAHTGQPPPGDGVGWHVHRRWLLEELAARRAREAVWFGRWENELAGG